MRDSDVNKQAANFTEPHQAQAALVGVDPLELVADWPAEAEALFGWQSQDILGKKLSSAILVPGGSDWPHGGRDQGRPRILDGRTRDHIPIPIEVTLLPPIPGTGDKSYYLIRDVSEETQTRERWSEESEANAAMVYSAPTGFCTTSLDGRFLKMNSRFCELVGYDREELLQMTFLDLTHGDDEETDFNALQAMLRGELQTYRREKRYLHKNGETVWVDITSSLLRDNRGRPKNSITVVQDINLRKQTAEALKESEMRFRTLFEQAPFSAQLLAMNGRTLQVNAAWAELWQASQEDIENFVLKQYNVLTDPQLKAKGITPYIQAAYAGESVVTPPILYDPAEIGQAARQRWVMAYVHPIKDENQIVREVMLIHHDVTDRIEAEAQLKSAKEAAESASRLKSAFLANMSHEIRTPLGAILGFTGLLKDQNLSPREQSEYLEIIERSGKSLTQIIDDILDLSRVEAGSLRVEKSFVRVQDLVEEVLRLLSVEAKKKNLSLALQSDPGTPEFLNTDPVRLKQIIINLVVNAIKFTHQGGVQVSLGMKKDAGTFTITIQDTGIGISPDQQNRLFRPFNQVDNSNTRQFGGTGLGLALSRRLAEALGGDVILAESSPGSGSTFVLIHPTHSGEIPINAHSEAPTNIEEARAAASNEMPFKGLRLLVVDDSADNRLLIERILSKQGAEVEFATNGHEAVLAASGGTFDLTLMDIQMPVMDGFEATRELRRLGMTKPIIALTAHAMKEELQKCLDSGCNAHLTKPINAKSLVEMISLHTSFERRA